MLKKTLFALLGIIAALAVIVVLQPSDFRISRSTTIAAPAATVFEQVNDFHKWDGWSPWAKLDPNMKQSHEGAPTGVGASYWWSGNDQVGEGRMTLTESRPSEMIRIKLEFLKPFAATNTAEFSFKPDGNQTTVTWSMFGSNNFMAKAFGLVMNMDKLVGADFEKGLAQLKTVAETAGK
jgi:uncharacterized protein YndB with AHSA1/START domain